MIGRGKLFLNSRVEKLLFYVAITRASGFRASLKPTSIPTAAHVIFAWESNFVTFNNVHIFVKWVSDHKQLMPDRCNTLYMYCNALKYDLNLLWYVMAP